MSKKQLAQTVEFLKSCQEKDIYQLRSSVCHLVDSFLTDLSAVSNSLKENGESNVLLLWFQQFIKNKTDIFFAGSHLHSDDTPDLPDGEVTPEERHSEAFSFWFIQRLLRPLGNKECELAHDKCVEIVAQLLQLVKWRDPYFLNLLLNELVGCLSDLTQIDKQIYSDDYDGSSQKISRFKVSPELLSKSFENPAKSSELPVQISDVDFVVEDAESCEILQINILKIVLTVIDDMSQFAVDLMLIVWRCVCYNIEFCGPEVKTISLEVIVQLLREKGLPFLSVLEYYKVYIAALVELLCSGPLDHEEKTLIDLEESLAKCINMTIYADKRTVFLEHFTSSQLEYFLTKLSTSLEISGFSNIRTNSLKYSLVNLVCHVFKTLPVKWLMRNVLNPVRTKVVKELIDEIGKTEDSQYLIHPLKEAIIGEFSLEVNEDEKSDTTVAADVEDSKSKRFPFTQSKRKRHMSDEEKPGNEMKSSTLLLLLCKLKDLVNTEPDKVKGIQMLEGTRVCLEVLCHCVSSDVITERKSILLDKWLSSTGFNLPAVCSEYLVMFLHDKEMMNKCLEIIVKSIGTLAVTVGSGDNFSEVLQELTWVLSIYWIPNDASWMDMRLSNSIEIAQICNIIAEKIESRLICLSLQILALLPKDVTSKWRVHIIRQAFTDSCVDIQTAAMKWFPYLLYHIGPNANHLVYDLLHPMLHSKETVILKTAANLLGPLACIVSRKATLNLKVNTKPEECLYESMETKCLSCDNMQEMEYCTLSRERPKFVDPNMFLPFLPLMKLEDVLLKKYKEFYIQCRKRDMVQSIRRLFGHIGIRSNNTVSVNMLKTCLDIIEDPDYQLRVDFSKQIQFLLGDPTTDNTSEIDQIIVGRLTEVFRNAKKENKTSLQETVLLTFGQVGRLADGDLLLVVIVILLESMISPSPVIAAVAYHQLHQVAQHKNTKTQNLFMKSRSQICKFLADSMLEAKNNPGGKDPEHILGEVANVLDFPDVKSFLQSAEKYLVPHLVSKATTSASGLIKVIANSLSIPSRKKLLINNTQYIFSYIVRSYQKSDLEKSISFLQKETEFDLGNLLRINFQRVHNELLLYLSTHYQQVFNGLKMLASNDESYKGSKNITTSEQMADYLMPRLLGVLAFFDSQLLNQNVPIEEKRLALESLISIIRLMGSKHISTIRHKVMNTLRIGLPFKDRTLMEISCRAWNCYVRSLELPFLGQMMSQIIATLLPLLEQLPKQIAEIFNFMIVENRHSLGQNFNEIYFLPHIPELSDANAVLKEYTDGPASLTELNVLLSHSIKGVTHESLDVRVQAFTKLKKLLRDEKIQLLQLISGNETADPVISQLMSVLISGCRETDPKTQCLLAECLGELGAIDPGRLELMTNNPIEENAKFQPTIDYDNFAVGLINEVVKAFLAATEPNIQNCSAFALQHLLQIYNMADGKTSDTSSSSSKLWNRFSESVQEILIPHINSKYVLTHRTDWSELHKPIYRSKKGSNYKEWVSNWSGYLATKVKHEKAFKVFQSCSATIKHHVPVALYILPHVVVQVLQDGTQQDVDEIYEEIMEVLTQVKKPDTRHGSASDFRHMSAQTVFSVLDYLTKWKRHRAQLKAAAAPGSKEPAYVRDPGYKEVNGFLERIPQDVLAEACYNCKAFTRSIIHFEQFVADKKQNIEDHLDFMLKLYVAMDEPDGVVGVTAIRQARPTLSEQILAHESLGQQQDAQACYERAIQLEPDEITHHQGLLRSLMELLQQNKALYHATGIIAEKSSWAGHLNTYRVEAAWKLGSWDKLQTCLETEKERNWPVGVGRILLAAKEKREQDFMKLLQIVRKEQMGPLSAASMEAGSYLRGYEFIARLHMLNEIEENMRIFLHFPHQLDEENDQPKITSQNLLSHWQTRLQMAQSSFRTQEPILTLRRTLFSLVPQEMSFDKQIGQWWLASAKIARKAGFLQTAYSALLQASSFSLYEYFLENAKWLWEKGENDQALGCLDRGITEHFSDISQLKLDTSDQAKAKKYVYAQALLLKGKYSEETSSMESNAIVKQYKDVIDIYPEWEDGHFFLARYYDKIMMNLLDEKERPEKQGEFILQVTKYFGCSLKYGNQYIYQSMPRLLSLWLDYGATTVEVEKKEKPNSQRLKVYRNTLAKLNKTIASISHVLAPYQLFTAFPQIISRICHAHPEVFQQLKDITAAMLVTFPQQAIWMMMSVLKSSYPTRVSRCQDIFATAKAKQRDLHKFITDATKLTERLLELCERDFTAHQVVSVSQHFKTLKRQLEDSNFSKILLPLQSLMTVTLPTSPATPDQNPFPCKQVFISGIEDTIEILPSLQRPKKITLRGDDGKLYVMMCKPKDDLRKDSRLMDFNSIINKFLRKDPETRRRQLHIRTYAVIPLNEECGLIEWVNNTSGLRNILMKLYAEKGLYTSGKELKTMMCNLHDKPADKLAVYKQKLLPRHPPVFREWFLRTFPDPTTWYNARLAYARTTAVISMVGYILGLGDRHGENILYDSTNGDSVHVDFNCLFNRGETFEWPEKVPFRLTRNMVDAMGPMGFEGIFRRAAEVTMRVMRNQTDPLMSILRPFIHDPLVEWSKPGKGQPKGPKYPPTESGEISNELAVTHVQNIEHRLKGILKTRTKPRGLPLSIEGHVNHLIEEATDEGNLSQMYLGWGAYL